MRVRGVSISAAGTPWCVSIHTKTFAEESKKSESSLGKKMNISTKNGCWFRKIKYIIRPWDWFLSVFLAQRLNYAASPQLFLLTLSMIWIHNLLKWLPLKTRKSESALCFFLVFLGLSVCPLSIKIQHMSVNYTIKKVILYLEPLMVVHAENKKKTHHVFIILPYVPIFGLQNSLLLFPNVFEILKYGCKTTFVSTLWANISSLKMYN